MSKKTHLEISEVVSHGYGGAMSLQWQRKLMRGDFIARLYKALQVSLKKII
ncbi:hypothetical protein P9027_30870 [Bacillus thuringiensis]|uniref:hypothetical protein n=1 Tax=Bacillus thuringiensis TaxID=1428 RepID=UPI002DB76846|nr:hypothetical protein [Bacillus thuringiensis]MEC3226320.1 hypothetical protein [Bacillus thuringiensis]